MEGHARMQVVIVDDHPTFTQAARHCLEARGYDVVAEASCAAAAIRAVELHEPDAMLLDVRLGEDDGFAVCDAVTRMRPDLAVLLVSVEDYEHLQERIESCGARGFVCKADLASVDLSRFWQPATADLHNRSAPGSDANR
jgi:DNA-binding NarL/FixJ family response regulator